MKQCGIARLAGERPERTATDGAVRGREAQVRQRVLDLEQHGERVATTFWHCTQYMRHSFLRNRARGPGASLFDNVMDVITARNNQPKSYQELPQ